MPTRTVTLSELHEDGSCTVRLWEVSEQAEEFVLGVLETFVAADNAIKRTESITSPEGMERMRDPSLQAGMIRSDSD